MINYSKQKIEKDDLEAVLSVLQSEFLTTGPKVEEFEQKLCDYTGAKYAVAVSSGTAALQLAIKVLDLKTHPDIITTPNTFLATINSILFNELNPILADIDEINFNIDPKEIENNLTRETGALLPVHFAGLPAKMDEIYNIAKNKNLSIIEDAAHALGASYESGEKVGSCKYSDLTTLSFHPVKSITTGEGGAIFTNNKDFYERLISIRNHGIIKDKFKDQNLGYTDENKNLWYYELSELSFNYRMTDIQAALGISQLNKIDLFLDKRQSVCEIYQKELSDIEWLTLPEYGALINSAKHLYVVQIDFNRIKKNRNMVMQELLEKNIATQVHYIPIYYQPYYRKHLNYKLDQCPKMEKYYNSCLTIPCHQSMTEEDVYTVINAIKNLEN